MRFPDSLCLVSTVLPKERTILTFEIIKYDNHIMIQGPPYLFAIFSSLIIFRRWGKDKEDPVHMIKFLMIAKVWTDMNVEVVM